MYKVNYACDSDGDHTTPLTECTTSQEKEFKDVNTMLKFINECSYVYNLDDLLGKIKIPKKKVKLNTTINIKTD